MNTPEPAAPPLLAPSLAHLLRTQAGRIGANELLRFEGQQMTFTEVDVRSNQLARVLQAGGIAPGDRVAVMLPNGLEFPVAWLAIAKARAVMVPINTQYRAHDLAYTLADSGARLLLADESYVAAVKEVEGRCPALQAVQVVQRGAMVSADAGAFARHVHTQPTDFDLTDICATDLLNIQYTSGTTGDPKGCMLTNEYWVRLAERSSRFSGMSADDVALTAQPFYYMDPQWNVGMCLVAGCPLVILPRFSASTFWKSVKDSGATFFYVLGTMPVFLLKQPVDPAVERGHRVRFVACSGIVPQLHRAFEERWGVPWREAFGMTETGVDLAVPVQDTDCVGSGAVGRPVDGKEARIVDAEGRVLGDGAVGELCVRGTGMMLGYWNKPAATAERMRDGWLHTGDLAFRDDRGYYHLVGRLKDMIRRGGENISAAEVEGVLAQHPAVRGAAVVPVPDELRGEEVKAYVQLQPDHPAVEPLAIVEFVRQHLAAFKAPRFVEFVDEFPRTPSERIAKHVLVASKPNLREGSYDALTGTWL
ncbi:MAG: AMP-binding protein [Gemmatimonadaceae bacterium]